MKTSHRAVVLVSLLVLVAFFVCEALASGGGGSRSSRPSAPSAASVPSAASTTGGGTAGKLISARTGSLACNLCLKEGDRVRLQGTIKKRDGRMLLVSKETGNKYPLLENSSLEKMAKAAMADPDAGISITARATTFKGDNYLFISSRASGQPGKLSLKEGDRIELQGAVKKTGDRMLLVSNKAAGKEYPLLENSLLEKMAKATGKDPDADVSVTARATTYEGNNYLFITAFSVNK